ncbi:MAG TPA: methyltransferase domain-containing protein [Candidatus Limnocylindrales bacterium]|nr:methyltransferase domain-containing protein [Candidatus Limnocylindrales bacterium]
MSENPQIGSYKYYERLYEVEGEHWWFRGIRTITAGILDARYQGAKNLHILDAGCGTGVTLTWLKRYSLPKQIVGIDLSWYALQFCQRRGHPLLCQSSVLELPFKSNLFDLIVCHDVLQHLPGNSSDKIALGEFYRTLKPGGCLLVRTNSSQGMGRGKSLKEEDYRMYRLDELCDKVQQKGFRILKATYANSLLSIFPTVKRYLRQRKNHRSHHHNQGLAVRLLPPPLRWLNILLYGVMKGEAWFLSKPSRILPFGHTIILLVQKPGLENGDHSKI